MENQTQEHNPLDGLVKTIVSALIKAGIGLAEDTLISLLHPHRKELAEAAVPVTEEVAAKTCQPGYVLVNGVCVPEIGG